MKRILYIIFCLPVILFSGCDEHEWPVVPENVSLHLKLDYNTEFTEWNHTYDGTQVKETGFGTTYSNRMPYGKIRYIVRTYPVAEKQRTSGNYTQEFVFTKDISDGYDHQVTLNLMPGNFKVMVWSDLIKDKDDPYTYDASNFSEIKFSGGHQGNNDYKDAFRGTGNIHLVADIMESLPDTLNILMQRPLAKYEFITNDVVEFIDKEYTRMKSKAENDNTIFPDDVPPTKAINLDDYSVVFHYVGFMPDAYSINTDKPVNSSTGVLFESSLRKLTESEATVGFDYVLVNDTQSAVTLKIAVIDKEGTQLSITDPIEVPLKRSYKTTVTGMFLMSEASGGVSINPDFNGDHNLIFP